MCGRRPKRKRRCSGRGRWGLSGAEERTRTFTPLRELAPEASASANSATSAVVRGQPGSERPSIPQPSRRRPPRPPDADRLPRNQRNRCPGCDEIAARAHPPIAHVLDSGRHRRRRRRRTLLPRPGGSLRFVGQIFLRLIRTIVAPLLFATLVVGIAGHSNLRQVGRMGVKSLIYFEVVTTLALLIGWAAITITPRRGRHHAAGQRGRQPAPGRDLAHVAGDRAPHLSREHRQGGGGRRDSPGRRVQRDLRRRRWR